MMALESLNDIVRTASTTLLIKDKAIIQETLQLKIVGHIYVPSC